MKNVASGISTISAVVMNNIRRVRAFCLCLARDNAKDNKSEGKRKAAVSNGNAHSNETDLLKKHPHEGRAVRLLLPGSGTLRRSGKMRRPQGGGIIVAEDGKRRDEKIGTLVLAVSKSSKLG